MDELDLLRDVVRALVAERRARAEWLELVRQWRETGQEPPNEAVDAGLRAVFIDNRGALDRALARLAEVNPGLVNG
jgi:hypothetical protein